jgi:hypothetical protein
MARWYHGTRVQALSQKRLLPGMSIPWYTCTLVPWYDAGAGARAGPRIVVEIRAADIAVELEPRL